AVAAQVRRSEVGTMSPPPIEPPFTRPPRAPPPASSSSELLLTTSGSVDPPPLRPVEGRSGAVWLSATFGEVGLALPESLTPEALPASLLLAVSFAGLRPFVVVSRPPPAPPPLRTPTAMVLALPLPFPGC
ncbi:unnamed protein product, partial [Ectocarpus sp. 12 AP-2014]